MNENGTRKNYVLFDSDDRMNRNFPEKLRLYLVVSTDELRARDEKIKERAIAKEKGKY